MTLTDQIICIALAALANFATRVTPFLLFRTEAATPDFVTGLGRFLPAVIMGMLVVYCYRNVNWLGGTHGLPEVIAGVVTVIVHLWKHSLFLTLIVGTLCYMLLINFIF